MVKKSLYILAGIITGVIVLMSLFIVILIDRMRSSYIEKELELFKQDIETLNLESISLDMIGEDITCDDLLNNTIFLEDLMRRLDELEKKLQKYEKEETIIKSKDFQRLKTDYSLLSIRTWFLLKKIQEKCGERFLTVLYFYKLDDCPECEEQGIVLSYYKKILGEKFMVFALDMNLDNPVIQIIKGAYNVEDAPSIIVNNEKHSGFVSKQELKEIICEKIYDKAIC